LTITGPLGVQSIVIPNILDIQVEKQHITISNSSNLISPFSSNGGRGVKSPES
jgi:hypothetical protein